jgi:hypothetical protein
MMPLFSAVLWHLRGCQLLRSIIALGPQKENVTRRCFLVRWRREARHVLWVMLVIISDD